MARPHCGRCHTLVLVLLVLLLAHVVGIASGWSIPPSAAPAPVSKLYRPGAMAVIPQDNRTVFYEGTKLRRRFRTCQSLAIS